MNHTDQNGLKASAYLLGISVEELIDVLHNASQIKEIRTTSGFPLSLPTRTSQTQPASKVGDAEHQGRRVDTSVSQEPIDANANEHQRDGVGRYTVLNREKSKHLETPLVVKEDGELVRWEDYSKLEESIYILDRMLDREMARSAYLCRQNERLRKAGIAMGMCLPDTDEANKAYRDFEAGGRS